MNMDTIKEIDVKSVMTKSSLPVGGYSVNPYVGCPHACRYCYASFMIFIRDLMQTLITQLFLRPPG
jgi:DNA repair photolyase